MQAIPLLVPYATIQIGNRYRVVQALNRLGGPEAHSTLETLANDPVEPVAGSKKLFEMSLMLLMAPRTRMTVLSTLLATLAGIFPLIACWSNPHDCS